MLQKGSPVLALPDPSKRCEVCIGCCSATGRAPYCFCITLHAATGAQLPPW